MDNDFRLIQELTIGEDIKRLKFLTELMADTDPMDASFLDMMQESTEINRRQAEFYRSYYENNFIGKIYE